jgi:pyruvate formate lyase activating enzyme
MTAAAVLEIVLEDKAFYDNSGGGLTVSGGEPLLQVTFVRELLELAKKASLHTAIDTCGAVPWGHFTAVLGLTDLFLYDIKHLDDAAHRRLTGSGNAQILDNLERLTANGQPVEVRIPLVPGCNDDPAHIDQIGRWLSRLPNITCVRILPYHAYARSKYAALGRPDTLPAVDSPTDEQLDAIAARLQAYGLPAVSGRR